MIVALSDQSAMPLWPAWAWAVLALAAAALLFLSGRHAKRDAQAETATVHPLYRKCALAHCHKPGTVWVLYADGTTDVVCPGDADRGEHRGWFYVA